MAALTVAGVVYLLFIHESFAISNIPKRAVVIGLLLAAVWHVAFLRLTPGADDDIHRYVWDGRLQRLGYNPYLVIPSDPACKKLHTEETRNLNNPDLPSLYPPGAQFVFRAVTAIHESVFAFKLVFVICELAIVLILHDFLRMTGRGTHLVLAFAWNPLLAIEVAGSGHIDIVGALLLVMSIAGLVRRWRAVAAVTFGLAIAVKFLPVVLLPLYWKRIRIRDAALAAAVVALLYLPFLNHRRIPLGSLGMYLIGFRFNGPVFAVLHHVAPSQLLAVLAVLAGLSVAIYFRRVTQPSAEAFIWPMAATLFCAPVVFPWYLVWLLPFIMSRSALPLVVWSVSVIPTYVMWHVRAITGSWGTLPVWVMLVEYGCIALAAIAVLAAPNQPISTAAVPRNKLRGLGSGRSTHNTNEV